MPFHAPFGLQKLIKILHQFTIIGPWRALPLQTSQGVCVCGPSKRILDRVDCDQLPTPVVLVRFIL